MIKINIQKEAKSLVKEADEERNKFEKFQKKRRHPIEHKKNLKLLKQDELLPSEEENDTEFEYTPFINKKAGIKKMKSESK